MGNMAKETICVLLAGGKGSRLHPLTSDRAKPSVPFGGKYRIIDFALSNCLHSGIRRVLVLTQYKSHSLQKHLRDAWSIFNPGLGEYITAVPPQMRTGQSWYKGTADAIFQNQYLLERSEAERVLILSGDHIYRMDYDAMIERHVELGSDLTVACMHVPLADASSFGIMTVNDDSRITRFEEKPDNADPVPQSRTHALASMGIYVFNAEVLSSALSSGEDDEHYTHDFGSDLLPRMIETHRVFGYAFGGDEGRVTPDRYWRDVGTIDSYYEANMDLLSTNPPLDVYQDSWPIRTFHGQHPPARISPASDSKKSTVNNSMLGSGCVVAGGTVIESILSARVHVEVDASVESSILFDRVRVGSGAKLRRCIIDKDVTVPAGVKVGFDAEEDKSRFHVSKKGIVVVSKGAFAC